MRDRISRSLSGMPCANSRSPRCVLKLTPSRASVNFPDSGAAELYDPSFEAGAGKVRVTAKGEDSSFDRMISAIGLKDGLRHRPELCRFLPG